MDFDPITARLTATAAEFDELVDHLSRRTESGATSPDAVSPQIATMVGLVIDPLRSIVIEQLDGDEVRPSHIGFDGTGRVAFTQRDASGSLTVTASHLTLLPALLLQSLRIHPGLDPGGERREITVNGSALASAIDELAGPIGPRSTWRASAAWRAAEVDAELRVVTTVDRGVWEIERLAGIDQIVLRPITVAGLTARLGDVVTGRVPTAVEV